MLPAPRVGPGYRQLNFFVARGNAHFVRQPANGIGRDAGDTLGPFGRVLLDALLEQLESRLDRRAVIEFEAAHHARIAVVTVRRHRLLQVTIPPQLVFRFDTGFFDLHVASQKQAVFVAVGIDVDQVGGIGITRQEFAVVQTQGNDFADDREQQRAVGSGPNRHPLVGDRGITGAHRVDGDELAAVALELG